MGARERLILKFMKRFALLCGLLGSWFLYSHSNSSATIRNNRASITIEPTDSLSILEGGGLFVTRCHSCHSTVISHAYDSTQWNSILSRMSVNAGLDSTQTINLSNYIFDQLSNTDTSYVIRTVGGLRQW